MKLFTTAIIHWLQITVNLLLWFSRIIKMESLDKLTNLIRNVYIFNPNRSSVDIFFH